MSADWRDGRVLRFKGKRTWHLIGEPLVLHGTQYLRALCGAEGAYGLNYGAPRTDVRERNGRAICRACELASAGNQPSVNGVGS